MASLFDQKQSTQAALASFTEWFWSNHPEDYTKWKEAVQKASHECAASSPVKATTYAGNTPLAQH